MNLIDDIEKKVDVLIKEVCEAGDIKLDDYDDFYNEGLLDSVKMMELVIQLEDEFGLEFSGDELYFDNFASLKRICDLIVQKKHKDE